jgi:hypothetical protein
MKKFLLSCVAAASLAACHQEDMDTIPGTDCGSEGHRIEATVDGDGQCLSANITAIASADGTLVLNGLALNGNGVTVQVDSMGYGDFPIDEVNDPCSGWNRARPSTRATMTPVF